MSVDKNKKYALFIGRWQPFHKGHKYIIDQALNSKKAICIAIRDTPISENDPYTVLQREKMIRSIYPDEEFVKIISIPDIESVNIGRNVGYDINIIETPEDISKISGTRIREEYKAQISEQISNQIKNFNCTIWFTGLPCSGKTTLLKKLKEKLLILKYDAIEIDGDTLRDGLNKDLSFSEKDRFENLRRSAEIAKLLNQNGHLVLASFVSPLDKMRALIKSIIGNVKIVYVKCPLEVCEARDIKGHYSKARKGLIPDFTGISAPYEEPNEPASDVIVDTSIMSVNECVDKILTELKF